MLIQLFTGTLTGTLNLKKIKIVLDGAIEKNIIGTNLAQYLKVDQPRTPLLYLLPKIHKSLHKPSGRPIVSYNNISIFLDRILREFVLTSKSYIQDTTDFINKISELLIPDDALLVSFDVTSLYTSIDHNRGLEAVKRALTKSEWSLEARDLILELLKINLTCNYFTFNDKFYLQVRGTAMGANVVPMYANISMADLAERFIYRSEFFQKALCWMRYIDDIFLVWTGTERELREFHLYINSLDDVKFTVVVSKTEIQFLDTTVRFDQSSLTTQLFRKETDRNTLLKFDSCHPRKMVRALPYSQMLRAKRVEAKVDSLENALDLMTNNFRDRGYP